MYRNVMMIWLVLRAMLVVLLTVCVATLLRFVLVRREMFRAGRSPPQLPAGLTASDVEDYLRRRDEQVEPLQPKAGSAVLWFDGQRDTQTGVVVLFIHGFSSSVQEISPVDLKIARGLRANLLRYRLSGHGIAPHERGGGLMRDEGTCRALLGDAATAFQLATLLGKRVVLAGCSTGATLSAWLAVQPWAAPLVTNLVLISPCFSLRRPTRRIYRCLRWPFLLLPRAVVVPALHKVTGRVHRIPYKSVAQSHCWTLTYPSEATLNAIGVFVTVETTVNLAASSTPAPTTNH